MSNPINDPNSLSINIGSYYLMGNEIENIEEMQRNVEEILYKCPGLPLTSIRAALAYDYEVELLAQEVLFILIKMRKEGKVNRVKRKPIYYVK